MLAQAQSVGTAAALATFERLREVLAAELGSDPSPESPSIHLALLRDEPVAGPDPRSGRRPAATATGPDFVGRKAELARALDAWSAAAAGSPSILVIAGEAGIGKTRLATELATQAQRTGALVLSARCYAAERSVFLQPVLDAFRSVAVSIAPEAVRVATRPPRRWPR